jgi:transaldolase
MTLICYDDEGRAHHFACENGFVSRVVSAVFHSDQMGCYSDARRVMQIMNAAVSAEEIAL